jgi:putative membrane protein
MADETTEEGAARFEVRVTSDSHFGWVRTRLALERTQMAWVRTGVSLIAFGFTIYQVLERLPGVGEARPRMPLILGLSLIATGIMAMLIALHDYRVTIEYLFSPEFDPIAGAPDKRHRARVRPVTLVVLAVGVVAFVSVLFHVP